MGDLLVDSAALIGLYYRRDHHHEAAAQFVKGLQPGRRFHLSNYIFDEVVTRLLRHVGHANTVQAARALRAEPFHTVHQITEDLQEEALSVFESQGPRGGLSFTDCTTVALMRRLELTDIFTFDRAFAAHGFTVLPRASA